MLRARWVWESFLNGSGHGIGGVRVRLGVVERDFFPPRRDSVSLWPGDVVVEQTRPRGDFVPRLEALPLFFPSWVFVGMLVVVILSVTSVVGAGDGAALDSGPWSRLSLFRFSPMEGRAASGADPDIFPLTLCSRISLVPFLEVQEKEKREKSVFRESNTWSRGQLNS